MARGVKLPTMIDTAQAASFIAAEKQGSTTMRTELVKQADTTFGVTKRDQRFTQQFAAHGRPVRFC